MRRAPPFRFVAAVTADTSIACATSTTAVSMSFRQPYRGGRNQWRRGFSDRSYSGERGHFVSGDSHFQSVQDANSGRRQGNGTFAHQSGLSTQYSNPIPPPPNVNHNLRFHQPVTVSGNPHILPPGDLSYNSHFHRPATHTSNTHFMSPPNHNSQFHQPRSVSGNGQFMGSPNSNYDTQFHRPGQFSGNRQPFRPSLQRPRPRPPDFREWEYAKTLTPSDSERFIVLSYNILADYLALDHRRELYFHIPNHVLAWDWRKRNLIFELGLWSADIMCLQEVDRFSELEEELKLKGYSGVWKMRTGKAVDGCAIFWRTSRFKLVHEESIEFNKLGLRDNVAQIGVFELINRSGAPPSSLPDSNRVVICNIHVLYNPKRGEIKLGQVRVLLNRADAVSKAWDDAPVVICGDFNCTPKSPLYNFISDQKLDLSGHDRDKISGQSSAKINTPMPYNHNTGESVGGSLPSTSVLNGKEDVIPPSNSLSKLHGPDDHDSIATKGVTATSYPDTQCQKDIIVEAQSSGVGDFNYGPVAASSKTPTGVKKNDGKFLGSSEATCHLNEMPSAETSLNNPTELENLCIDESKEVRDEDDSTFLSALHDMAHDFSYDLDTSKRLIFDKSNQSSGLDSSFENSPLLHSTTEEGKDGFSPGFNFGSEMTCARYDPSSWTPMERELATGKSDYNLVEHCLTLTSTYTEVEDRSQTRDLNREPIVTSYNRRFFGTVDYIWRSEGLQTMRVLAPIPKHAMQWTAGFPTKKWGSDHIALASELAFSKDVCDSTCR